MDYFYSPIFVLGIPRSGTSMVSGSIAACNVWTGSTVPGGTPVQPKGFFEHTVIRENIIKQILTQLNADPLGVRALPPVNLQAKAENIDGIMRNIVEKDGYQNSQYWLLKDCKLTLIWPILKAAFPKARWLIVKRDEQEVINSCLRTHFMRQHSGDVAFWEKFIQEYNIRLGALKKSGAKVFEIDSKTLINGNFTPFATLISDLGLEYNEKAVKEFVDPQYWHHATQ